MNNHTIKNGYSNFIKHKSEFKRKINIKLKPGQLSLSTIRTVFEQPVNIILDKTSYEDIKRSADLVQDIVKQNRTVYGINTGIGKLASKRIDNDDLEILQSAIVTSHAAGVGAFLDDNLVRLIMLLKVNSLSRGYSGVRQLIIDTLIALINADIYPQIPEKGSVGASGDLAPLSHMSLTLLGIGKARFNGEWIDATEALQIVGVKPVILCPKEGVALINGGQVSAAFALRGLFEAEDLFSTAVVCGSLSVEAALGSRVPFDERIQLVRGQKGQIDAASAYRFLLGSASDFSNSHRLCKKVQDPYSLRCQPQVMGACLTQIRNAAEILEIEANAVSDNPLVFAQDGDVISGANFHAEPTAMAADNLAIAIAEIGSISERRIALLMDEKLSQLPAFLTRESGLFSGFMTVHVTAAAMASENKALAHPSSVDSIPTSGNQEDHVSMAPAAGRRLWTMAENVRIILSIELLAACQGLDMRPGLKSSLHLEIAREMLREKVSFYENDRYFAPDLNEALNLLKSGCFKRFHPPSLNFSYAVN